MLSFFFLVSLVPGTLFAQVEDYTVLAPLPNTTSCQNGVGENCTADLSTYLPGMFNLTIGVAAVLAFIMIVFGGFLYATTDAIQGRNQGKDYITNALYGLGLVIGAWAILNTINPQILSFKLDLVSPMIKKDASYTNPMSNREYVIAGYNIGPYATDSTHEVKVAGLYNNELKNFSLSNPNTKQIDEYIQKYWKGSPITGDMILKAARSQTVDYRLMMAIMQQDSNFGTKGLGSITNNPGNVGNTDDGKKRYFSSWQEGVNAVAIWLNKYRVK